MNPIVAENQLPGTPESVWQVPGVGDTSIQGFTTDISVDQGQAIDFSINDPSGASYHIDIFRMGYYQGDGARLVTTIPSSDTLRQDQPAPMTDYATGLVDAGNWAVSASWAVPSDATSGIYFANVRRDDTGGASQIFFVVRDDASTSDIMFQTSDSTWQAYNTWDGTDSYQGSSLYSYDGTNPDLQNRGHALAVSYNRPLILNAISGGLGDYNSPLHAEYPMVRWMEANGYDVTYTTDVDTARYGNLILNHKVFLSVGHDEYWSAEQRDNIEAALDAGVNLGFFSGNEGYWKTRWAPSLASPSGDAYRTVISYKESQVGVAIDPMDQAPTYISTGTWRDQRFGSPSDGGRPENALTGQAYMNDRTNVDLGISMNVPASDGDLRFWRNTSVADLAPGQVATLGQYVVGYETDEPLDNGFQPAGLMTMSSTTFSTTSHVIVPWGTSVGPGTSTHQISLYRAASGALVFGAGTVQWSWGLDGNHNNTPTTPDLAMQQATVNLFADMYAQPSTLQPGLVPATASTDTTPPVSTITTPSAGASFPVGSTITISGTAVDSGGGVVAGVEISTDGGATWHPAVGREDWSYTWTVDRAGPVVFKTRAVDDSGNLETPSAGITATAYYLPTSTSGLVAAYDFDEGSGTTVTDLSGNGNQGTASNTTWAPGLFGQALSFNGSNSWVTVADSSSLDLTAGMTLEAWVKPASNPSGSTTILAKERSGGLVYSLSGASGSNLPPQAYTGTSAGDQNASGSSSLPLNTWSFLTASYDGTNLQIYVNGVLVNTLAGSGPITTSTGALRIGGDSQWGDYFSGLIDQVRIYDRALSPAEIQGDMSTPINGPLDSTPPTGSITGPAPGATVSGTTTISAGVSDNVMVAGVQFLLNGATLGEEITSAPYTLAWDTRTQFNGAYTLSAVVRDSAGNLTTLNGPSVTISNPASTTTPPGLVLTNPTAGLAHGTIVASAFSTDPTRIAGVQFQLNGTNIGPVVTSAPYRITWDSSVVADGTYVLTSVAHDFSGDVISSNAVTIKVDNTPPTASGLTPADSSAAVPTSISQLTAILSEPVQAGTIKFTLQDSGGYLLSGEVAYDPSTGKVTFSPDARLEPSTTYTATLSGALDLAGNPMIPASWTFTTTSTVVNATLWSPATTPTLTSVNDFSANELGVRFESDVAGYITGIRFYKGSASLGTHVGHLWNAAGQLLGTVTFTNESASGWQQADFAEPIAIDAGATYTVSYYAPQGGYVATGGYFAGSGTDSGALHAFSNATPGGNGVYYGAGTGFPNASYNATNYWVDVVFSNALVPTASITQPSANATDVPSIGTTISATFSKPVQPGSIVFTLQDASGNVVPSSFSYEPTTGVVTLTPISPLDVLSTYTATLSGAQDAGGLAMAAPLQWTFTTAARDVTPPTVISKSPTPGATLVANAAPALSVIAVFSEPVQSSTIAFTLTDPAGNTIATTVTYDTASHTVALIPNQALDFSKTYTANLSGAQDLSGNLMAPISWSFTTNQVIDETLFGTSATPAVASANDSGAVEVGVKFQSDVGGYVTGVRFYKGPLNIGTHVAHIWAANDTLQFGPCPGCNCGAVCFLKFSAGALIASATFTSESASGWQEVTFAQPVLIMPNTTYVVSYTAPSGGYAYTGGYFANSGVDSGVLHASASGLVGGNGVFGAPGAFPSNSYNSANYWVDPVFSNSLGDHTAPTIVATTPHASDNNVSPASSVTVTFSETVDPGSVAYSLVDASGQAVPVTASWIPTPGDSRPGIGNTLILTPQSQLSPSTTYTVTISSALDLVGNALAAPMIWSFTTAVGSTLASSTLFPNSATPAVASANDTASLVLGVRFTSDASGYVTGLRFYKGPGNTGTHVGYLWDASGNLLATATFADDGSDGWQQVSFPTPVPIAPGATYVAGYYAPNGGYAYTSGYFNSSGADSGPLHAPAGNNGVFSYGAGGFPEQSYNGTNYWVDVVFGQPVVQAATNTSLAASTSSGSGGTLTLTATVAVSGGGTPAGSVTFLDGSTSLGTVTLDGSGVATLVTSTLPAGAHQITAVFGGSAMFTGSTSNAISYYKVGVTPGPGESNVGLSSSVTATFGGSVDPGSVTYSLADSSGHAVPVNVSWTTASDGSITLTLMPQLGLSPSTTYTASIGAALDTAGNALTAPVTWSFTTALGSTFTSSTLFPNSATPAVASANDTASLVLGVRFTSDAPGYVTGVRFYKGPGNTGTHVGYLWDASGNLLATATFADDGSDGWQQVSFPTPVPIAPGATYVAGYYAPNGGYAYTSGYFNSSGADSGPLHAPAGNNGVFSYGAGGFPEQSYNGTNYWVDVVFGQPVIQAATSTTLSASTAPAGIVTLTATVAAGAGTPAGSVTFLDGGAPLGTVAIDGSGTATLVTSALSIGSHQITAAFAGDSTFTGSTSDVLSLVVNKLATNVTVNSSASSSTIGQTVTFTAAVAASAASGIPTGTVTFFDGSTPLATVTLGSDGLAAFTTAVLGIGSHDIGAVYNGDSTFEASTATPITQVVNGTGGSDGGGSSSSMSMMAFDTALDTVGSDGASHLFEILIPEDLSAAMTPGDSDPKKAKLVGSA
ncbi:DUF4082 domain-containing protein [Singulisphaera sp. PoT]|uniref:DUF4082 domain-containing protein n=1 Tax=Singulisphaera sp. PoT TaxID=3411797 RepID=UPI003BF4DFD9